VSWEPVNLRDVPDEPPTPPELGGLVYEGRRHWWSGPPESGKTLVAYGVILLAVRAGRRVALVDFEMGARDAKARLRELGAADEELDAIDFYAPDTKPRPADLAALVERGARLVVLDAAAGAFDLSGLDENRDAEKFNALWVQPLWKAGATTIVLDHVVKNPDSRGMFASGHHRKIGGTEVHLGFEATTPLRRGHTGLVKVTAHKDRTGFLRSTVGTIELRSDPDTHEIEWEWKVDDGQAAGDDWRPTRLMEKVSRYIEQAPANRAAIQTNIIGKRDYLIAATRHLLGDGYAEEIVPGAKGTEIRSLRPYREESSPAHEIPEAVYPSGTEENRPHRPPIVPDRPRDELFPRSSPSSPPPTGGDGDGDDPTAFTKREPEPAARDARRFNGDGLEPGSLGADLASAERGNGRNGEPLDHGQASAGAEVASDDLEHGRDGEAVDDEQPGSDRNGQGGSEPELLEAERVVEPASSELSADELWERLHPGEPRRI
jgi:hypothetical protein